MISFTGAKFHTDIHDRDTGKLVRYNIFRTDAHALFCIWVNVFYHDLSF
jgi:hypothetical protein